MKQRKLLSAIRGILHILVFTVLIGQLLAGKIGYVYLCTLTLVLMELPSWAERRLGIALPGAMEIMLLLFIFSSEILGEIMGCYTRYPCWDVLLHGISGFLFASIGYVLPQLAGRRGTGERSVFRLAFSVCFSLSIGVAWEFLEWGADALFGLDMQKDTVIYAIHSVALSPGRVNSVGLIDGIRDTVLIRRDGTVRAIGGYLDVGLHDTMGDLLADLVGAVVFGVLSGRHRVAQVFVPEIVEQEEQ